MTLTHKTIPKVNHPTDPSKIYIRCMYHEFFYGPFDDEVATREFVDWMDENEPYWDYDCYCIIFGADPLPKDYVFGFQSVPSEMRDRIEQNKRVRTQEILDGKRTIPEPKTREPDPDEPVTIINPAWENAPYEEFVVMKSWTLDEDFLSQFPDVVEAMKNSSDGGGLAFRVKRNPEDPPVQGRITPWMNDMRPNRFEFHDDHWVQVPCYTQIKKP